MENGAPSPFPCPGCGAAMELYKAPDLAMMVCPGCGGQWLDNEGTKRLVDGELANWALVIAERAAPAASRMRGANPYRASPVPEARVRHCPACGGRLTASHAPLEVVVDACRWHGTFFDAWELDRLDRYYDDFAADEETLRPTGLMAFLRGMTKASIDERFYKR